METFGNLRAIITADLSGFDAGMDSAGRKLQGFAGNLGGLGGQISSVGGALTGLTAPILLGLGAGIKVAADFEGAMKDIQARAKLTAPEMKKVSDFALKMGADTTFSAQDAAQGMLELLSAGQSVSEAMSTLPAVLDEAAAGSLAVGDAAAGVVNTLAEFGLGVGDARTVVDLLSQAAGASTADIGELVQSLGNVGPVAKNFGLDLQTTIAALGVLANNGIKGAEAGTALKSMLTNFQTDTAQATFKALGVALVDAEGNFRNFSTEVLPELKVALDELAPADRAMAIKDLAGSYGQTALSALLAGMSVSEMAVAMGNQATAAETADAKTNTFSNRLQSFLGSLEAVATKGFTPLLEASKPVIDDLIAGANAVGEWVDANPVLTMEIIKFAAGLALLGPVLSIVGGTLTNISTLFAAGGSLLTGMAAFTGFVVAAVGPIGAMAVAVTALAGAILLLNNGLEQGPGGGTVGTDANGITGTVATAFGNGNTPDKQRGAANAMTPEQLKNAQNQLNAGINPYTGQPISVSASHNQGDNPMSGVGVLKETAAIQEQLDAATAKIEAAAAGVATSLDAADKSMKDSVVAAENAAADLQAFQSNGISTALETLAETGLTPNDLLTKIGTDGIPAADALNALLMLGIPGNATLKDLHDQGLISSAGLKKLVDAGMEPSYQLKNAVRDGLPASAELRKLIVEGLTVTVRIAEGQTPPTGKIGRHALGGHMNPGDTSIVGEKGPEVFTTKKSGWVIPNEDLLKRARDLASGGAQQSTGGGGVFGDAAAVAKKSAKSSKGGGGFWAPDLGMLQKAKDILANGTGWVTPPKAGFGGTGGVNFNGPVNIYGVENVEDFWDKLTREGEKRGMLFGKG